MTVLKALYHNGEIDFIEKPAKEEMANVLVVFPETKNENRVLRGSVHSSEKIDYNQMEKDLGDLSKQCEKHLREKMQ